MSNKLTYVCLLFGLIYVLYLLGYSNSKEIFSNCI